MKCEAKKPIGILNCDICGQRVRMKPHSLVMKERITEIKRY